MNRLYSNFHVNASLSNSFFENAGLNVLKIYVNMYLKMVLVPVTCRLVFIFFQKIGFGF